VPGSIIISNHEGTDGPLSYELYADTPIRFWGAYEMNSGLKALYKYQTEIYYHQKKHWNLTWAKIFCLAASPVTYVFYKGLNLISTYPDVRFAITVKQSMAAIEGGESVVVFPENSEGGYQKELKEFFPGFVYLAEKLYKKKGIDVPIHVAYFKKEERELIVDKAVYYTELKKVANNRDEITKILLNRCNEISKYDKSILDKKDEITPVIKQDSAAC
jgi:hypothetical protein